MIKGLPDDLLAGPGGLEERFAAAFRHRRSWRRASWVCFLITLAFAVLGFFFLWRFQGMLQGSDIPSSSMFHEFLVGFLLFSTGCFLVSVFAIVDSNRARKTILGQRGELEETSLAVELVSRLDDEHMQFFGSWLHDNLGHGLVLLKMDLEHLLREKGLPEEPLANAMRQIDGLLAETRGMAASLYPRLLAEAGLRTALESLLENFGKMTHFQVDSALGPFPSGEPDERRALAIYRTVQECLTNAAKYGKAELVWVSVREKDGFLSGKILNHVDAGPSKRKPEGARTGIGLDLMDVRLRRFGGHLSFGWTETNVFQVEFSVPVRKESA